MKCSNYPCLSPALARYSFMFLLCRPLFHSRLSKRWQYYIWQVIVARLFLPFAPETNLMGAVFQKIDNGPCQPNPFHSLFRTHPPHQPLPGLLPSDRTLLALIAEGQAQPANLGAWRNQAIAEAVESGNLKVRVVSEKYPELKVNANFTQLQSELAETENKIALSRQFYNDTVLKYNNAIELFPASLIAGLCGFFPCSFGVRRKQSVKISP